MIQIQEIESLTLKKMIAGMFMKKFMNFLLFVHTFCSFFSEHLIHCIVSMFTLLPLRKYHQDLYKCNICWKDDKTLLIAWADVIKVEFFFEIYKIPKLLQNKIQSA